MNLFKNKVISIGYTGNRHCYLNVNKTKAIKRYCKEQGIELVDFDEEVRELVFKDQFWCYDIWN